MKLHSDPIQRKWDILHTFCYSYICQPPQEYWGDEEVMAERNKLLELVENDVHRTNWKSILSANSNLRLITLSIRHAKDFYDSEVIGEETEPYRAIKDYFKRADWERQMLRSESPPPIQYLIYYMKTGDVYSTYTATEKKTKRKK
jgi:hypothetical protein